MIKKHRKVCKTINYFGYFLVIVSVVSRSVSISEFASLVGAPVGIASSAVGFKISANRN